MHVMVSALFAFACQFNIHLRVRFIATADRLMTLGRQETTHQGRCCTRIVGCVGAVFCITATCAIYITPFALTHCQTESRRAGLLYQESRRIERYSTKYRWTDSASKKITQQQSHSDVACAEIP